MRMGSLLLVARILLVVGVTAVSVWVAAQSGSIVLVDRTRDGSTAEAPYGDDLAIARHAASDALRSSDATVRVYAAGVLGQIGAADQLSLLAESQASERDERVRLAVEEAQGLINARLAELSSVPVPALGSNTPTSRLLVAQIHATTW